MLKQYGTMLSLEMALWVIPCLPSWASTVALSHAFGLEQSALAPYALMVWIVCRFTLGALVLGIISHGSKLILAGEV